MDETAQQHFPTIDGTGLLKQSTAPSTLAMLKALPTSLTDDQFNQVKAIAKAALPSLPPQTDAAFAKALKILDTLPRRKDDKDTGKLRFNLYRTCLSHLSEPQLWWVVNRAVTTCDWYPSVKQLLDIAALWERRDEATEALRLAKLLVNREVNRRLREQSRKAPAPPLTQEVVDAMAPELRGMGLKLGYLIEQDGKVIPAPEQEDAA